MRQILNALRLLICKCSSGLGYTQSAELAYIHQPDGRDPCVDKLGGAIMKYGAAEMMNTNLGRQFTSSDFIGFVHLHGVQVRTDVKGFWRVNVFVERLWKSVKYEEIYLHSYETVTDANQALNRYFGLSIATYHTPSLTEALPLRFTLNSCG